MNYNFFADKADKIQVLNFVLNELELQIFDLASHYDKEVKSYANTDEILSSFDLENGGQSAVTFQLWSPRLGGSVSFRKIALNPLACEGHTYRYATEGWGLIQLYFGGQQSGILHHSHIGHFSPKGASKWEEIRKIGSVDNWNWAEIQHVSGVLKRRIHTKMAVRKEGSYGVMPGADGLSTSGIVFQ